MAVGHKIDQGIDGRWTWKIVNINLDGTEGRTTHSDSTFSTENEAKEDIERYCLQSGIKAPLYPTKTMKYKGYTINSIVNKAKGNRWRALVTIDRLGPNANSSVGFIEPDAADTEQGARELGWEAGKSYIDKL